MSRAEIFEAIEPILMEHYAYRKDIENFNELTPLYYQFELDNDIEGVHPSKQKPIATLGNMNLYPGEDSFPNSSFAALAVVMDVEDLFGIEIPDCDAEKINTVGELISYIEEKTKE